MKRNNQIQQIRTSADTPKEIKVAIIAKMKRKTLNGNELISLPLSPWIPETFAREGQK